MKRFAVMLLCGLSLRATVASADTVVLRDGSPEMVPDVQSITIVGRRYLVSTEEMVLESDTGFGKNRRTAEAVGGGAALSGVIGTIAGGGKGAAVGVHVGGVDDADARVLTRGRDVQVPAETLLTFRLDKPCRCRPINRSPFENGCLK